MAEVEPRQTFGKRSGQPGLNAGTQRTCSVPASHSFGDNLKKRIHIRVSLGYTAAMKTKDVGLRIRVERDLRDEFLEACRLHDRPAAQVLREFMRRYVAEHKADAQPSLFPPEAVTKGR